MNIESMISGGILIKSKKICVPKVVLDKSKNRREEISNLLGDKSLGINAIAQATNQTRERTRTDVRFMIADGSLINLSIDGIHILVRAA